VTYSRVNIDHLIVVVESGLAYGELKPYAKALRDATAEIDRLASRLACAVFENQAFNLKVSSEINALRAEVARLTAERDAMREVVEAADQWRKICHDSTRERWVLSDEGGGVLNAVEAYRASKAGK
jgi:hypothetical protein